MRATARPTPRLAVAAAALVAVLTLSALRPLSSDAKPSAGQLRSRIANQGSRERTLSGSVAALTRLIAPLERQIALVQGREAAVRSQLTADRAALAQAGRELAHERRRLQLFTAKLARARIALARQLVSSYEHDPPDIVGVVLESNGFADLLDRLDFLRIAKRQQERIITRTKRAKTAATRAAQQLAALEARDRAVTVAVAAQANAIAAMDRLLQGKRETLRAARAARLIALRATRARGSRLKHALARLEAQQARSGPPYRGSGGWAIPAAVVMCESGGQNLPPNSAGASGYYQFLPSTWQGMGGSTPAAYEASKAEQDRLAAKLWDGGRGASNWVCAGIVGAG